MKFQQIYIIGAIISVALAGPVQNNQKSRIRKKFIPSKSTKTCFKLDGSCEVKNYPATAIAKLMRRRKNSQFFSNISLIEPVGNPDSFMPSVRDAPVMKNLCSTKTITISPKSGFDYISNQPRFIVNDQNFQTVKFERCLQENVECIDSQISHMGFQTQCIQKYNHIRLVSVSYEGKWEYGLFMVPTTCVCNCLDDISNII